jgi:hypothetical protein
MAEANFCTAKESRGTDWDNLEMVSSLSGTPSGVIMDLFERIARYNPEKAEKLLVRLQETLVFEKENL